MISVKLFWRDIMITNDELREIHKIKTEEIWIDSVLFESFGMMKMGDEIAVDIFTDTEEQQRKIIELSNYENIRLKKELLEIEVKVQLACETLFAKALSVSTSNTRRAHINLKDMDAMMQASIRMKILRHVDDEAFLS